MTRLVSMALSGQEYRKLRLAEGSSLLKKPLTLTCQVRRGRKRVHYGCVPGEGKNSATYLNNGASGTRGPGSAAPRTTGGVDRSAHRFIARPTPRRTCQLYDPDYCERNACHRRHAGDLPPLAAHSPPLLERVHHLPRPGERTAGAH